MLIVATVSGRIGDFDSFQEANSAAKKWIAQGNAYKVRIYFEDGRWWASETSKPKSFR